MGTHVAFLEDEQRARDIEQRVRAGVRACAGHPAVLCYAIGNEIPVPSCGGSALAVERFLERLYRAAKAEDPDGLVTYVNYPSTEYLEVPFLDFVAFNVYLETQERYEAYLARLQNLAGDRPLVVAEIGLDSRARPGGPGAGRRLAGARRVRGGCAGAFVFAWTDEWHRGGYDVEDWDFGLTDRQRRPKAALTARPRAFAELAVPDKQAAGRPSRSWCAATTARAPSATVWWACSGWTTPASRSSSSTMGRPTPPPDRPRVRRRKSSAPRIAG